MRELLWYNRAAVNVVALQLEEICFEFVRHQSLLCLSHVSKTAYSTTIQTQLKEWQLHYTFR